MGLGFFGLVVSGVGVFGFGCGGLGVGVRGHKCFNVDSSEVGSFWDLPWENSQAVLGAFSDNAGKKTSLMSGPKP